MQGEDLVPPVSSISRSKCLPLRLTAQTESHRGMRGPLALGGLGGYGCQVITVGIRAEHARNYLGTP